jgi:L-amino acid N-acyltransferase YncA
MIRSARPADSQTMMEIYNDAVEDQAHANCDTVQRDAGAFASQYFFGSSRYISVIKESSSHGIAGWGALKRFSARPFDQSIAEVAVYIGRQSRSSGLGIHLLKRLMSHAQASDFHSLIAIILGKNVQSIRGCAFCGFEERVRLRAVASLYGEHEDIVWMQKVLAPTPALRVEPTE